MEESGRKNTIFILLNAQGPLQFMGPKIGVLDTKCGQMYKNFNVLKLFWMATIFRAQPKG